MDTAGVIRTAVAAGLASAAAFLSLSCSTTRDLSERAPVRTINMGTYEVSTLPEAAWQVRADTQAGRVYYQADGSVLASASLLASIIVSEERDEAGSAQQDEETYTARIWEREVRNAKKGAASGLATAEQIRKSDAEINGRRMKVLSFITSDHALDKDFVHLRYLLTLPSAGGKNRHYLFSYVEVRERFYEGSPDFRHIYAVITSFRIIR